MPPDKPRVIVTPLGEVVCIDCELAGWQLCKWHKEEAEPKSHGMFQLMSPDRWPE